MKQIVSHFYKDHAKVFLRFSEVVFLFSDYFSLVLHNTCLLLYVLGIYKIYITLKKADQLRTFLCYFMFGQITLLLHLNRLIPFSILELSILRVQMVYISGIVRFFVRFCILYIIL